MPFRVSILKQVGERRIKRVRPISVRYPCSTRAPIFALKRDPPTGQSSNQTGETKEGAPKLNPKLTLF